MNPGQIDVSVTGPLPQRWSLTTFALPLAAALLITALAEGGTWASVGTVSAATAALVGPIFLKRPWQILCAFIVPAILTGEIWKFAVSAGTRITVSLIVVFSCMVVSPLGWSRWKKMPWRDLPLLIPFSIYWVAVLLSVIPSVNRLHWARGLLEVTLGYAFFLLGYLCLERRDQLQFFLNVFLSIVMATVLFAIVENWLYDSIHGFLLLLYDNIDMGWVDAWYDAGRLVGNWVHPSNLGSVINLAGPIALYYYLESDVFRLKYLLSYGVLALGVVMTATRTPIIAFVVSSAVFVFLTRKNVSRLILPLLLLALALPFVSLSLERFDLTSPDNEVTLATRAMSRFEAFMLFMQNPVLGVGARNYEDRVNFHDVGAQVAAHNVFVQQAAETGLVGITAFIALLYAALRSDVRWIHKLPRDTRGIACALFASCLAIVIECLAENSLYVWQVWCVFWLVRGISAAVVARPDMFAPVPRSSR